MSPPKATIVYIVTSGSYSDYGIHCAFTDPDVAQRYCDVWNAAEKSRYDRREVEEYELDSPSDVKIATSGKLWWTVWILQDGDTRVSVETFVPRDKNDKLSDRGQFTTRVYCKDRERAIKVAQERLMQHKARLAGIG